MTMAVLAQYGLLPVSAFTTEATQEGPNRR